MMQWADLVAATPGDRGIEYDQAATQEGPGSMYADLAQYYDRIYAFKDYVAEARTLAKLIHEKLPPERRRLLDVACGTGRHITFLKAWFDAQGLDNSEDMLQMARASNPEITFHQGDMAEFSLRQRFDVLTCLFSSIGYLTTLERLHSALRCMVRHLEPGGLLLIEPWFTPESWHPNTVHGVFIDEPELKIARVNTSFVDGQISYFDFHYLLGTPRGTVHAVEHHELALYHHHELVDPLRALGMHAYYDKHGFMDRGLIVAQAAG